MSDGASKGVTRLVMLVLASWGCLWLCHLCKWPLWIGVALSFPVGMANAWAHDND